MLDSGGYSCRIVKAIMLVHVSRIGWSCPNQPRLEYSVLATNPLKVETEGRLPTGVQGIEHSINTWVTALGHDISPHFLKNINAAEPL